MNCKNYFVKQHDMTDCAAACLASICLYYKKSISINKLRDLIGTDVNGTNLIGLQSGAEFLGFDSKAIKINKDSFNSNFTLPAIANVITSNGISHFVVIHKIKKNTVIILDPATGIEKKTKTEFLNEFTGILFLLKPNSNFIPSKEDKTLSLFGITKLFLKEKKLFIYSIIASFLLTLIGIISSFFNKVLIDQIIPYKLSNQLKIFILSFFIITITQITLTSIRQHILLYISQKINISLLLGYFKHIYKLPYTFFNSRKVGDLLTRFNDATTIKNIISSLLLSLLIDILLAFSTAIMLYIINKSLFMIILLITLFSSILIYIFKKPYKTLNILQMEAESKLNSHLIDSLNAIETIKAFAIENKILDELESKYIKNLKLSFKEGVLSNIQNSLSSFISSSGNLILMFFGTTLIIDGKITLGTLMSFLSLSAFFMSPIERLLNLQLSIQEANVSLKRLSEILTLEIEQTEINKLKISNIDGDIKLTNVTFRYGSRKPTLNNLNMTIPKGKKVALVGASGSGKTTVAKLLLKYYDFESGSIEISNTDINDIDIYNLRKAISYVPQNVELFSESIKDNILLGNNNITFSELKYACENSNCDLFINKLPAKYNTFLDSSGNGLSGGQKQSLGIARALIKDSNFIIFDEATSNLDTLNEYDLYKNLFKKYTDKTMLIISHKLSNIIDCDLIYVMSNGSIVESGTHSELIKKQGHYYNLFYNSLKTN